MGAEAPAYDHGLLSCPGHLSGIFREKEPLGCYDPTQSRYTYKSAVKMTGQDQISSPFQISIHVRRIMCKQNTVLIRRFIWKFCRYVIRSMKMRKEISNISFIYA